MRHLLIILFTLVLTACQNISERQADETGHKQPTKKHHNEKTTALPEQTENSRHEETNTELLANTPTTVEIPTVSNLWPRFQSNLQLDYIDQPRVKDSIQWYIKNRRILEDFQLRAQYYLFFIMDVLEKQDIPFDVALIPIIESQYNPFASGGQPAGLWQFMPATGRRFNLTKNAWYDGRKDPVESTKAVAAYFRYLMNMFDNDILLSLAAYNSGEGTVQNAINKNRRAGKPVDYWHLDLPGITDAYIPKMIALAEILKHPEKYELNLLAIKDEAYFVPIKIPGPMSLTQVASALNIPGDELYYLNAGLNRNTRPDRSQSLINIPADKADNAQKLLITAPAPSGVNSQKHLITSGETLGSIARKYHVSTQQIKEWNHLSSDIIIKGKTLNITAPTVIKDNKEKTATIQHKVKSGESLWKIAQIYKVKVTALAQWNKKSIESPLKTGETLLIYTSQ